MSNPAESDYADWRQPPVYWMPKKIRDEIEDGSEVGAVPIATESESVVASPVDGSIPPTVPTSLPSSGGS